MKENEIPSPELIAQQLRKPSGEMALPVGYSMNKSNESLYDLVIETMRLQDGESVLEIGFGNGKFFDKLFTTAADLKIAGLDYSAEMLEEAIKLNQQNIETGKLELKHGNSDKIPFTDNSFDKIFCCNVIYFWDDPAAHLKEIKRVLNPGGNFYSGFRSKASMSVMPFTKFGFTLYEAAEWENVLKEEHFTHVETKEKTELIEMEGKSIELKAFCVVANDQ